MKPAQDNPPDARAKAPPSSAAGARHIVLALAIMVSVWPGRSLIPAAQAQAMAAIVPSAPLNTAAAVGTSRQFDFSIGRVALESALTQYQETTGIKLFYDSPLVMNRTSPGVTGHYPADEALSALLAGTNLYFVRTTHDIVTLVPMSLPPSEANASSPATKLVLQTMHVEAPSREVLGVSHYLYGSIVEGAIRNALQQEGALKQRRYNADIFIWVSHNGSLQHFQLANSTGNTSVDGIIVRVLDSVTLHQAPPSDLPQPLHVRIRANL